MSELFIFLFAVLIIMAMFSAVIVACGISSIRSPSMIVMNTDYPGWKPEGFMRESLTIEDIDAVLDRLRDRMERHFEQYGDGIFTHPHEIVGCLFGQQMKLSTAADESIYTGELDEFEERCMKMLLAILVGTASVDKLKELRDSA